MTAGYFLTTLGLVPYFASRALLPLFVTALVLRLGAEWAFLPSLFGVAAATDVPMWATSNVALLSLGVAAAIEGVILREPALRESFALTETGLKVLLALGLCLVLAPESQAAATDVPSGAGLALDEQPYGWAVVIAGIVGVLAHNRARVYTWLSELDTGDDLGLQRVFLSLEEALGVLGVVTVFVVPMLAVGAALGAIVCSFVIARRIQRRRAADLVPCGVCTAPLEACAPHCPECRTAQPAPRAVGILGRTLAQPAGRAHADVLKARKRCTFCGTRIHGSGVELACERCNTPVFSSRQAVEVYLQTLSRDIPTTLLVMAAFGAVPIFGLFAGVLYFRLTLLAAIRQYTPTSAQVLGRWALRSTNGALLLLQPVPVLGAVTLPLTAVTSTWFYARQLKRAAARLKPKDYSETLRR